jgi:hypothetical protein
LASRLAGAGLLATVAGLLAVSAGLAGRVRGGIRLVAGTGVSAGLRLAPGLGLTLGLGPRLVLGRGLGAVLGGRSRARRHPVLRPEQLACAAFLLLCVGLGDVSTG